MPVFKDFAENGELLQTRDESLNADNFSRYIKEHGSEKAQGYLDALEDITNQLYWVIYKLDGVHHIPVSSSRVKRDTQNFYHSNYEFLEAAKLIMQAPTSENSSLESPKP